MIDISITKQPVQSVQLSKEGCEARWIQLVQQLHKFQDVQLDQSKVEVRLSELESPLTLRT